MTEVTEIQREEFRSHLRMHDRPFDSQVAAEELSRCGVPRETSKKMAPEELKALNEEGVIHHVGRGWFRWIR